MTPLPSSPPWQRRRSASRSNAKQRLLLVGAGHTHLHLLAHAERLARVGFELTVIAPRYFRYSGLATSVASGALPIGAATIDVAALAARRGVVHLEGWATSCDPSHRTVTVDATRRVGYDVASFNVGSVASTDGLEVATSVATVKPFEQLLRVRERIASEPRSRPLRVSVVGAGPTGLELAGQLASQLGRDGSVTIFERGPRPGAGIPEGARRRVLRILTDRGVRIRPATTVHRVEPTHLLVEGDRHDHDLVVIATGLVPTSIARQPGFGGEQGIPVRATLQHVDHDDVYAVGDGAHFTPQPLPKLGVYGVRQGPVLERSLLARQAGAALPEFVPQRRALQILDLGGGTGLAWRGDRWAEGRLLRRLKLGIDLRWLARYR